jgi:DNA integrity scanning protein DisA with diadenylate cyclase activity
MEDYMKNLLSIGNEGMLTKKIGEEPIMTLFIKSIIRILQISKNEIGDIDAYIWISLLNTLLEQFPTKLDGVIILFIKILVTELSNKEISKSYRLHVLLIVAYMFIYNSPLTLKMLTDTNVLIPVCQNFFSSLTKYTEIEQFRCLIYGITTLISTDAENLHEVIKSGMPKIIESLIKLMHKYVKEREREKSEDLEDQISSAAEETEEVKIK